MLILTGMAHLWGGKAALLADLPGRLARAPVELPSEQLREVLGRTLRAPLFKEQAMQIRCAAVCRRYGGGPRSRSSTTALSAACWRAAIHLEPTRPIRAQVRSIR